MEAVQEMRKIAGIREAPARMIRGGKEYFDLLLRLIGEARETIHLQTYIYDDDETGKLVADALIAARKRNVDVYLLADGYASQVMSKKFIHYLRDAGINVRLFEPLLKSRYFYFGRRMHHKIFVADGQFALVGGVNISDRYNDMPGKPAWLDLAFYAEGEIAYQLCVLCWKTWNGFARNMPAAQCRKDDLLVTGSGHTRNIEMRRNDWVRNENEISASYLEMFRESTKKITILCSYFLPGKKIRQALSDASRRGVCIKVITAGRSDVRLAKHAERWLYDWLLRHKIEVYEYQPAILHAKLAVCDGKWFTIGSYNVNDLSAYASIELNLDIQDTELAAKAEAMTEDIIAGGCKLITVKEHRGTKNIFIQFTRWCAYHLIRVAFHLLTFYYKQKD
jgi:cardiolipin synthase